MKHPLSTYEGIKESINKTIDTSKLTRDEIMDLTRLVLDAFCEGNKAGVEVMSKAWEESNQRLRGGL